MARAAHAEEIDLRLRDSTRYAGELTIDGGIGPFGSVLVGGRARSRAANLARQILDFERCDPIAKHRERQAVTARILGSARLAIGREWSSTGRAIDETGAEPPLLRGAVRGAARLTLSIVHGSTLRPIEHSPA
jgi:hypothetical protein